jgi:predicted RNA-binding Zn-ribbon protein involved in translation (DUF1610 family)
MSSLRGVNRLGNELLECHNCDKALGDTVRDTYRCPECGDYVHVYAEDVKTATKIVLLRKRATEVEEGDWVYLPGMLTKNPYLVLAVRDRGDMVGLALKNYREYKVAKEDGVNIRVGSW